MKRSPVMYKNEAFLHVIFMASALGILSVQGNSPCFRPLVQRGTNFTTSPGKLLILKCPVNQCGENLNVSWIKENGTQSSQIRDGLRESRPWDKEKNLTIFSLHFDPVLDDDGGSYQCIVNFPKKSLFSSHHINVCVTSEYQLQSPDIYVTNSTEAPLEQRPENVTRPWLLYMLPSMGLLCIFILTCLSLFFWQRKKRAKQKKHPDTLGRGTNQERLPNFLLTNCPLGNPSMRCHPLTLNTPMKLMFILCWVSRVHVANMEHLWRFTGSFIVSE
ncbi:B- and T-lymphocyte attenuator isoform X3 [Vombatus ursinus]|uniref:B- and T-lymphocyte attenuator isoform X3 n=1 Tax=Vombatus ursinus TaxID=29139 RepID=UPI000FFCF5B6|nr:B- and T-lymphocyte attenuator isoform X3 [Vombatus ursinus]